MAKSENKIQSELEILELEKKQFEIEKLKKENVKLDKESLKVDEEREKIKLESKELRKKWYKKPLWWSAIGPFIIGAAGVFIAFKTNIFGIQELQVKARKLNDSITLQKITIQKQKTEINLSTDTLLDLNKKVKNLSQNLSKTKFERESLILKNEINKYKDSIELINLDLMSVAGEEFFDSIGTITNHSKYDNLPPEIVESVRKMDLEERKKKKSLNTSKTKILLSNRNRHNKKLKILLNQLKNLKIEK